MARNKVMRPVVITRKHKHEVEQAVNDLLAKGFELISPMKQLTSEGKEFKTDSRQRRIFVQNTENSCWMAKMRRVD